ncbi:PTS system N-acetylglucosamine-specific IIB component (Glc family) /PTS system N-acetylglucosamine-specific IIC component (Glc family) [Hephaestia caeni]|uniref:PTS system N-acetylglucosamine-specific IIB component (Glc family) /PTS system N-acetylglucosamine-specific IIC component (Glc family) n=1 Tax=Hephaestia caeni TaxID=645617 RepID=A0A397PB91_9SPHN|nr:N-acetylglucosamine-specific PTS transporter subunit IIBC [Hephaestia caeni]RIA44475.1 PTS system N-acetylglucosamine-specific IIB component (Glc family) /PTS system N-acetylglucosamine-specific IIC component (Glc family) [Hephaestia caeni]
MRLSLQSLQPLGRALMLPIAVLPVAALLLRLGQPDLFDVPLVAAAGAAIFDNLGLLFALGIGVGLAKDNNGAAGLAGLVCFLVATRGSMTLLTVPPDAMAGLSADATALAADAWRTKAIAKLSVPIGILSGLIAGAFYNRYATIRLPEYLAFFGGRRFVPILSGVAGLGLALVFGGLYTPIDTGMDALSKGVIGSGEAGLFFYGLLNRLLIVTGLHHILNNLAWFLVGDYHGSTGDLNRFFAGDPSAGAFMAGFFPVMMFGLPAACLAMYRSAFPERRKAVGGMLLSMALTAILTGVTEPIEFSFMFLAPLLYALHAVLTGLAMAVMDLLGIKLGFGFSAGLLDYALNFSKATRPLLLLPVGIVYFLLYYGVFRFAILRFNLKTPGREDEPVGEEIAPVAGSRGPAFVAALGGAANLASIDACTTRLRLVVADQGAVDEARLRALGAKGFVRPSAQALQVVLGPEADLVATEMRAAAGPLGTVAEIPETKVAPAADVTPWLTALGGRDNLAEVAANPSRLMLRLRDDAVDDTALTALGVRAVARTEGMLHLIVPDAEPIGRALAA